VGCVGGHIVARAIGDLEILPPSVVGVNRDLRTAFVQYPHHVALYILLVPVLHAVVLHSYRQAIRVVHIVDRPYYIARFLIRSLFGQDFASVHRVYVRVDRHFSGSVRIHLLRPYSVRIVLEEYSLRVRRVEVQIRQSVPAPIHKQHTFPVQRVSRSVIGDRCAVVIGQQIAPCAVRVTVGFAGFEFA